MSDYALRIGDEDSGPYAEGELREKLEQYRREHPEDSAFGKVMIHEMTPGSTVGTPRSVYDFID